tara:strand:- start:290 stop:442 length:153 start_codon:yes stop_codon:yes gene_type:complete
MNEVVWAINNMIGLLLIAVGVTIYWIFKYDEWNPNPVTPPDDTSEGRSTE